MYKILSLIVICSYSITGYSQVDNKYLVSVIYLNTQTDITERVNDFFVKDIPKKSMGIPFYIEDSLSFVDIEPFKEAIIDNDSINGFDFKTIGLRGAFRSEYYFDPIKTDFLGELMPFDGSKLILTFSKVYGNVLIAEITNFKINKLKGVRFGRGYRILFLFDEKGMVTTTYEKTFIYN